MKYQISIVIASLAVAAHAQRGNRHGGPPGGFSGFTSSNTVKTITNGGTATDAATNTAKNTASNAATNTNANTIANSGNSATDLATISAGSTQTSATTPAPTGTGGGNGGGTGGGVMTISIVNSYSVPLSLAFGSNAGAPPPIGNPTPTAIGKGATTAYSFPTQWAGRIYVGKSFQSEGSKIEGSVTGPPDMDVSYVDGYSVPIICTSAGKSSGCTTELFGHNNNYCGQAGTSLSDFQICLNPKKNNDDGTADPFFAPCEHIAYTYPSDNAANQANVDATTNCCIGTACGGGSSKRDVQSKREDKPEAHVHGRHVRRWGHARSNVHRLLQNAEFK